LAARWRIFRAWKRKPGALTINSIRPSASRAAFEDGDPALIAAAIGDAARAHGMTRMAQETGLAREALYRALSESGNPEFTTVLKVLRALEHEAEPV